MLNMSVFNRPNRKYSPNLYEEDREAFQKRPDIISPGNYLKTNGDAVQSFNGPIITGRCLSSALQSLGRLGIIIFKILMPKHSLQDYAFLRVKMIQKSRVNIFGKHWNFILKK